MEFLHETEYGMEFQLELDERSGTVYVSTQHCDDEQQGTVSLAGYTSEINQLNGSNSLAFTLQMNVLDEVENWLYDIIYSEYHNEHDMSYVVEDYSNVEFTYKVLSNGQGCICIHLKPICRTFTIIGAEVYEFAEVMLEWINETRHWLKRNRKELVV